MRAGTHDQLGEGARALDPHHSKRSGVRRVVVGNRLERHDAGRGDAVAGRPAGDARSDGIDDARAVDARDARQHGVAPLLRSAAQQDVERPIDGRRANSDPHLAEAGLGVRQIGVAQDLGRPVLLEESGLHTLGTSIS